MAGKKNNTVLLPKPERRSRRIKWKFSNNLILSFLLGLITLTVYANTLKNGFVLDDHVAIQDNFFVKKGISAIPQILVTPYHEGWLPSYHDNLYRPLSLIMFAAEYQFFELNPLPYHLINILLFAGCAIVLFLFLDKLFERKKTIVAIIAALLFALHPIHTEVVANIKSGDELLCFFFAFFCLNVFVKYLQRGKIFLLIIGAFCFFLSLLSKETSLTFLVLIPLIFFFYRNEHKRRSVYVTLSVAIVAIIILVSRYGILNHYYGNDTTSIDQIENALANKHLPYESRIATAILILGYYIKLLFIPYPLICDYSFNSIPYVHFSDTEVLISLLVYVSLSVYSTVRLLKNHKDTYAFAILFFLVSISIFTNIPFLLSATMAERFLFFGSAGFCIIIALLTEKLFVKPGDTLFIALKNPKVLGLILPILLVYGFITINRNKDWSDNFTLFTTDLEKAPNDSRLNYYVADILLTSDADAIASQQKENIDKAIPFLYKAIAIYPEYMDAELDLGVAYSRLAQYDSVYVDSSEIHYKQGLKINPKEISLYRNLAGLFFFAKEYAQSIEFNKKALEIEPNNVITCTYIGLSYLYSGKYDSAIYYADNAIIIEPRFNGSYEVLASAYKALGNQDSSRKYEAIARVNNPALNP